MPYCDYLHCGEQRQNQCKEKGKTLGHQQHSTPTPEIGQRPTERSEKKCWHLCGKSHDAKPHRRIREPISQPNDGHLLHPGADERDGLTEEENAEISTL